jgi:prepilin-type N-terminal cleavage/methylation domain-containing protein
MKLARLSSAGDRKAVPGFTLVEMMVSMALASIVLATLASLSMYGARSFAGLVNYVDLDAKSRNTMDVVSRELRMASALITCQSNLPVRSLTLTNASNGSTIKLTFDSTAGTLVFEKTGQSAQTSLTQCASWDFKLYNRVPILSSTNITFYSATNGAGQFDPTFVKLINMTWKCTRSIFGANANSESVQTAQIVLRNKVQ